MVTEHSDPPKRAASQNASLSFRIGALLTAALLPLGLIAVLQTFAAIDSAHDIYRQSLAAQTTRAARPEAAEIMRVFGLAQGLADAAPAVVETPELCVRTMQRAAASQPNITFAGFVGLDQTTTCNNLGQFFDFASPESDRVFEAQEPDVTFNPSGNASGQAVVIVSQPVQSRTGEFMGFVSVSFPTTPLAEIRARAETVTDLTLITFSADGRVLTAGTDRESVLPLLPAEGGLSALSGTGQRVFTAMSVDGAQRDYALTPILANRAYALGIWDEPRLRNSDLTAILRAAAFPMLMWLASLVVAIVALRREVVKPIHALRMRMRSFADGRTVFRASSVEKSPRELQDIGETFERLADQIIRDEADLEDKVHEREILLREVHHRVKNNLQLMSSIINMQIRQKLGPEAEDALRRVQDRLASLAKFHEDLYESSSLSRMSADQLLEDLARQTVNLNSDPNFKVDLRLDLDPVRLEPDQAGPLAMLVTEALTNAMKHARKDPNEAVFVAISMKCLPTDGGDRITIKIENSVLVADGGPQDDNSGLGTRLIAAFASQLYAEIDQGIEDDRYVVKLVFMRSD